MSNLAAPSVVLSVAIKEARMSAVCVRTVPTKAPQAEEASRYDSKYPICSNSIKSTISNADRGHPPCEWSTPLCSPGFGAAC